MEFLRKIKRLYLENADGINYAISTLYGKDYYPNV